MYSLCGSMDGPRHDGLWYDGGSVWVRQEARCQTTNLQAVVSGSMRAPFVHSVAAQSCVVCAAVAIRL